MTNNILKITEFLYGSGVIYILIFCVY